MKIYIASLGEYTGKIKEDVYIRDRYASKGFSAEIVDFNTLENLVDSGDVVILKSIWGYHLDSEMFLNLLSSLEKKGVRIINRPDIIRWNINKFEYIKDIFHLVPVVPTFFLDVKKDDSDIDVNNKINDICILSNSERVVIKPVISASGYLTGVYQIGADNKSVITPIIQNNLRACIIQPYRDSIEEGEISIVILRGEILYGILRNPGLFTVKRSPTVIPLKEIHKKIFDTLKTLIQYFVEKFGSVPDICRVDFIQNKAMYEILEIELIDPDLYFKYLDHDVRDRALSAFSEML